jgi:hypothetical protein
MSKHLADAAMSFGVVCLSLHFMIRLDGIEKRIDSISDNVHILKRKALRDEERNGIRGVSLVPPPPHSRQPTWW